MIEGLLRFLGFKEVPSNPYNWINNLHIDEVDGGWYIMLGKTVQLRKKYAGPYKTAAAAKGQLTRLRKGYTPAAKRALNDGA